MSFLNNFKTVKQYGIINNEAGSGMAMVRGVKWKEFSGRAHLN